MGTLLMFDHRTAHQFTQNALLESPQARTQVPLGWTRASEYPTLVAPWLHGEPHQSREECLAAFAGTGKPPKRWPHVYTGNVAAQGAAMFRPALPALPAVPTTALARVLTGIDKFDTAPCATAWLLRELPGSAAALAAEEATVADHKRLMLGDMLASLHRRLRRLASGLETGRLAATTANSPGYGLRVPELATDATSAVPKAAQAAFRDYSLARTQSKRKRRGHATEGYDALTPPPPKKKRKRK